jgi:hypothetical protein
MKHPSDKEADDLAKHSEKLMRQLNYEQHVMASKNHDYEAHARHAAEYMRFRTEMILGYDAYASLIADDRDEKMQRRIDEMEL